MRFRATIQNIHTFTKLTASLSTLGHIAWLRLDSTDVRFTVIPEHGTQVWAVLAIDSIFETYSIQSAADDKDTINLEVPLAPLLKALKSAQNSNALAASLRLTKKEGVPLLSLTITTATINRGAFSSSAVTNGGRDGFATAGGEGGFEGSTDFREESLDDVFGARSQQDRETTITQDIPIRVLAPASVSGLHEPRCREPDVHIVLPNLQQLKSISDRFTRLGLSTKPTKSRNGFIASSDAAGPKLELAANMHGCLRLSLRTEHLHISTLWTGLENPELDPEQVAEGEAGIANHPSTLMKALGNAAGEGEEGWASVRVEGKDWGRVLSVGRLGGRVIACFCHGHAVVLYVFVGGGEEGSGGGGDGAGESVLTYYISSYSA